MPTTEWQDLALLGSGSVGGWKKRMLVRFRLQRKRALRLALERMEQSWAVHKFALAAPCHSQAGTPLRREGGGSTCAEWTRMLQCPAASNVWGRLLWDAAGQVLITLRAHLKFIVPLLLFLVVFFSTVSFTIGVGICLAVATVVWINLYQGL
jgi:hypothetical protein